MSLDIFLVVIIAWLVASIAFGYDEMTLVDAGLIIAIVGLTGSTLIIAGEENG